MRILYIHSGYHTNHDPRIKALQQGGHAVKHLQMSFASPNLENPSCEPTPLGMSHVSKLMSNVIGNVFRVRSKEIRWMPIVRLWREMKKFRPDIVVIRDYYINTGIAIFFARILRANCVVQEQSPLHIGDNDYKYAEEFTRKKMIVHKLYETLSYGSILRITPVKGNKQDSPSSSTAYYIPFTINPDVYCEFKNKKHFKDGYINIICVTDYRSRKQPILLLNALVEMDVIDKIRVTIIGERRDKHTQYYEKLVNFISENQLENAVRLKKDLNWEMVQQEYSKHDLFVLPSKHEPAAVSPLEAMAAGLPVICSDTNGTKDYVIEGETGYIFRTESKWDLKNKIRMAINDRHKLKIMGRNAYDRAHNEYHPDQYCNQMESIIKKEFGES